MLTLALVLSSLSALVGLVWATRHIRIWRENRKGFMLTPHCPGPPPNAPMLSVVVAAKDEEECIEGCLRSMLGQDYPNFEIIVCNDRSTDRTAEIVRRVSAEDPRVRLVNITHLPEGWAGKCNAMQTGIAAASGQWLCMIDADCRQVTPRTLSVAMQHALDEKVDFLSVLPRHEMVGFWEHVVQPVGTGVMMIWFNPDDVNNPRKKHAYANGAFMMMTRQAYEKIGTHEAVRCQLNEDMHMADIAKRAGLKLKVVRSKDLELVRMYTTLKAMLRGWSRIFFGTFGTLKRLTASLTLLVAMGLLPMAAGAMGLLLAGLNVHPPPWWWMCGLIGLAATGMQLTVIYRFYALIGARKELAWSYPLGCGVIMLALIISLSKLRKGAKVTWRSTSYTRPPSG